MFPRVFLGLVTHNEEGYIEEAVRSLLSQSYPTFLLAIVDDASTDATGHICKSLAATDPRVRYFRNAERLGLAGNYREALAKRDVGCEFFAWIAGHDRYHPQWLEALLNAMDDHPEAVLAYSDTLRIGPDGGLLPPPQKPWHYLDTRGLSPSERVSSAVDAKGFGTMIYGLLRTDAIQYAGGMPQLLFPDVVFLWRLSCYGDFIFVPKPYYFRRETKGRLNRRALIARQRRNLFVRPNLLQRLPPAIAITYFFLRSPLTGLPSALAERELAIRRLFARRFLLKSLRKRRLWRYLNSPFPTLARRFERLMRNG